MTYFLIWSKEFLKFMIGLFFLGLGINIFILSGFGGTPWDAVSFTLNDVFQTNGPGLWIFVYGLVLTIITLIFNITNLTKKRLLRSLLTILIGFLVGFSVNTWRELLLNLDLQNILIFILGLPVMALGVVLISTSLIPSDPLTNFMDFLIIDLNFSATISRFITDGSGLVVALLLGIYQYGFPELFNYYIGIGTIVIFLLLPFFVGFFYNIFKKD